MVALRQQVYLYRYVGKDSIPYEQRVTLYRRIPGDLVIFLLQSVDGTWPHRLAVSPEKIKTLTDAGKVACVAVLIAPEDEEAWRDENLIPE